MDLLSGEEQKIDQRAQVGDRIDAQLPLRVCGGVGDSGSVGFAVSVEGRSLRDWDFPASTPWRPHWNCGRSCPIPIARLQECSLYIIPRWVYRDPSHQQDHNREPLSD